MMIIRLILLASLFLSGLLQARKWTDTQKREVEAEMLEYTDSKILFKLKNGKETWFEIAKLSQADQDYINAQKEADAKKKAEEKAASYKQKILFIGNSYTAGMRGAMKGIIAASPYKECSLDFICPGGRNLLTHSTNDGVLAKIKSQKWDYIVLQDQSQTPAVLKDRFIAGLDKLDKEIDANGAKTVLYMTWGHRDGDKQNPTLTGTYKEMQDKLKASYEEGAKRADAKLSPVGEAWRLVRNTDEKLGVGLYSGDGRHPSKKGAYLIATMFYVTLFGEDPTPLGFTMDLPKDECSAIQKAVLQTAKVYGIKVE